jgi:hypothetical protein
MPPKHTNIFTFGRDPPPGVEYLPETHYDLQCGYLVDYSGYECPEEPHYRLPKTSFRDRAILRQYATNKDKFEDVVGTIIKVLDDNKITLDEFATYLLDPIVTSLTDDGVTNELVRENKRLRDEVEELKRPSQPPTAEGNSMKQHETA